MDSYLFHIASVNVFQLMYNKENKAFLSNQQKIKGCVGSMAGPDIILHCREMCMAERLSKEQERRIQFKS